MVILPINPLTAQPVSQNASTLNQKSNVEAGAFRRELNSRLGTEFPGITFSRHAQKRLDMRGIMFTPDGIRRIEQAVEKARLKGSKDALVVAGGLALVVNVPSRTVVTVMNQESMRESVITNIDSAVFA